MHSILHNKHIHYTQGTKDTSNARQPGPRGTSYSRYSCPRHTCQSVSITSKVATQYSLGNKRDSRVFNYIWLEVRFTSAIRTTAQIQLTTYITRIHTKKTKTACVGRCGARYPWPLKVIGSGQARALQIPLLRVSCPRCASDIIGLALFCSRACTVARCE